MIYYDISNIPAALLNLERAETKVVAELYWITWAGTEDWYYCNWHDYLNFDGKTWEPRVLSRSEIERGTGLMSHKVTIESVIDIPPFERFVLYDVPVTVRIRILRYFPNSGVDHAWAIFNGYITSPEVIGRGVKCLCVDKTFLLERDVIRIVFQPCCNWRLGDPLCGINLNAYTEPGQTVQNITGNVLTFNALNGPDGNPATNGYYTNGWLVINSKRYTIVDHTQAGAGGTITLLFLSNDIVLGASVSLTAGCDGKIGTCHEKFNNLDEYEGFPFIPLKNPATEIELASTTDADLNPTQDVMEDFENEGELVKL